MIFNSHFPTHFSCIIQNKAVIFCTAKPETPGRCNFLLLLNQMKKIKFLALALGLMIAMPMFLTADEEEVEIQLVQVLYLLK